MYPQTLITTNIATTTWFIPLRYEKLLQKKVQKICKSRVSFSITRQN